MIMDNVTLDSLIPGEHCVIQRIESGTTTVRQRLLEMGLTRGTNVELIRFAPMGDPIEISVRGYRLSLRRIEAESVIVSKHSGQ